MSTEKQLTISNLLSGIENFFIPEDRSISQERQQKTLGKIWELLSIFYPYSDDGEVTLTIPSERLVTLGLVSERAAGRITRRRARRGYSGDIKPEDEPLNIIRITKKDEAFRILKTYVSDEETGLIVRKDFVTEEETFLEKGGSLFTIKVKERENSIHLHCDGKTWLPINNSGEGSSPWREAVSSAREINRTLALTVEGIYPGYFTRPI